ncbi:hypothetical protein PUR49_08065 [Streptomyces sp. BE147]|uniref:hypothetical protein n=1 Tax=Streptomyces sp. BE147 TaxID=3002524 RepID=UPI002E79EBE9|nr:hypothetical protein [Streptomyces sp. BE147]MEE1736453.1 hypothetical protein [Streptomyces sp. BE147]
MVRKPKASASAAELAARGRAQQLALVPMARQQRLLDSATDFFVAQGRQDQAREDGEREIRAIRERVVEKVEAARVEAGGAVVAMLGEDEPVGAVAERLGLRVRDVQELRRLVRVPEQGAGVQAGAGRSVSRQRGPVAGAARAGAVDASAAGDGSGGVRPEGGAGGPGGGRPAGGAV